MKFVKFSAFILSVICLMMCLAACGGGDTVPESSSAGSVTNSTAEYKDGEYKASAPSYDDSGYKATAKVVVKNGKVYSVDCDADSKDGGTKKAHAESGKYDMKKGGAQYGWHEEIAFFERYVTEKGVDAVSLKGDGKTDVITGCTIAVSDYVDLINEALNKAKK
jgi:major membrane immunogen (membrane-anchored lipoprotein)